MTMPRRGVLVGGGVVLALIAAVAFLFALDDGDGFTLVVADPASRTYSAIFLLIAGDAVIPIFPGETTLNAASTLAAQGSLSLPLVIVTGALGAIVGDSTLFWIARLNAHRVRSQLERAQHNARVAAALGFLGDNTKVLLTFGRYVPGLRFVVNTTMGLSELPYRKFVPWSVLGGVLWSSYTCLLAYWIGSTLDDYPLASVVISGVVTTGIMGLVFFRGRHRRRTRTLSEDAPTGVA
jgi:membrane protein DedA with SNARE-associated domain